MTGEIYRKEILPYYLMVTDGCGVSAEYIDNSFPTELEPYEIAYNLKMKQKDSFAYACVGNYVTSAVLVAVDRCLNGRKAKSEYIKKPILNNMASDKEDKIRAEREKFVASLMAMKANFEMNHPKKEG